MARNSYQYGTSPRKYEPEYSPKKTKKTTTKQVPKKQTTKKKAVKNQTKQNARIKTKMIFAVIMVFGMLLTISYREIALMEMFNQKKGLENKLAVIDKENGQIDKNIKEIESTLDWNKIKQVATEQLGMEAKAVIPIDLEKTDFIEKDEKLLKEEKQSLFEKVFGFLINK